MLVFNPATRSWRQAELRGDVHLLKRTAHGACTHPLRPGSILMMGGYGGPGEDLKWVGSGLGWSVACVWGGRHCQASRRETAPTLPVEACGRAMLCGQV